MKLFIFHHNDMDGITSAGIVYSYYNKQNIISDSYKLDYTENRLEQLIKQIRDYDVVYVLDYSINLEYMLNLIENNKYVVFIDHHTMPNKNLMKYLNIILDNLHELKNKFFCILSDECPCTSVLTWEYLYPNELLPKMLEMINKYDAVPGFLENDIYALNYGFYNNVKSIENIRFDDDFLNMLIDAGWSCVRNVNEIANKISKNVDKYTYSYRDKKIVIYNACQKIRSHIGRILQNNGHKILIAYTPIKNTNNLYCSIYSSDPTFDAAKLALEEFGGGGHAFAAGFVTSFEKMFLVFKK